MKIRWTQDHEFDGLEGWPETIPDWAVEEHSGIVGVVIYSGMEKLNEPIFIHPFTAEQLAAKKILERYDTREVEDDRLRVEDNVLDLFVGPA